MNTACVRNPTPTLRLALNYKLLFPTYRTRYCFTRSRLETIHQRTPPATALNLGMGEGDYDRMIARYCGTLYCCDINEEDVRFAQSLNADLPQIHYAVKDALDLDYPDSHFDVVLSIDVIEHVSDSRQLLREVTRVLRPGGTALITFPSSTFPFTYDPINAVLRPWGKHRPLGAYGFGHFQLIDPREFENWVAELGLEIEESTGLSGYLSGLAEMYWVGFAQRLFKSNARNLPEQDASRTALRPTTDEPALARLTDLLIAVDNAILRCTRASVGRGYLLRKPAVNRR